MTTYTLRKLGASIAIVLLLGARLAGQAGTEPEASSAFRQAMSELQEFDQQHGRTFDGSQVTIHYLEWTQAGLPLILLHGTYSTAHDFARFAPRLVDLGYRPVAEDWYRRREDAASERQAVVARDFSGELKLHARQVGDFEGRHTDGHSRVGALACRFR